MELKSFREILLKKADGNPYLKTLIEYAKDEIIAEEVLEALQKMAEPKAGMGSRANHAITSYAAGMKPMHVEQLRDAIGHHVSHYKAALKAHHGASNPEDKKKLRSVADQHLNKIVPMMHLAGRASKHSGGNLVLDYPSMVPWETNYTGTERRPETGKLKEGTKDLRRRANPNIKRANNPRGVPDYQYLEMPPHPGHDKSANMPHKGGYPFEEIQLGHPNKRDLGQAYLPTEDVKDKKEFTPHPFDNHPVHPFEYHTEHELQPEHYEQINSGLANWADSDHNKKWLADQKAKHAADPEAYKARGTVKPGHHYEGIPLQEMPHHKGEQPQAVEPEKKVEAAVESKPKESVDIGKAPEGADPYIAKIWDRIPEEDRAEIIKDIAKRKK